MTAQALHSGFWEIQWLHLFSGDILPLARTLGATGPVRMLARDSADPHRDQHTSSERAPEARVVSAWLRGWLGSILPDSAAGTHQLVWLVLHWPSLAACDDFWHSAHGRTLEGTMIPLLRTPPARDGAYDFTALPAQIRETIERPSRQWSHEMSSTFRGDASRVDR
jgi:hypothetical protein